MENSTQSFLEFDQIRDGVIILKNKGLRMILMVSSLNFALKSEEEKNAIIYQFQNFLNSLEFSCQIVVQSRHINITGYTDELNEISKKETNELLKIQIKEYIKFINQIVSSGSIMQKTFYVVVPFSISEIGLSEAGKGLIREQVLSEEIFQRAKIQLSQRTEFVSLGLKACGLTTVPLDTIEITELFWSLHHQEEAEGGYYPEFPPELSK